MKIWKWELERAQLQSLELPKGAEILTVQIQHNVPHLWAMVDENATETEGVHIAMHGTGHTVPQNPGKYLGTVQFYGGALVLHVFEVKL